MHLIQERERLRRLEQPTDLGPLGARQQAARPRPPALGPRPVVQVTIRTKQTQRRLGLLPTRLALLMPVPGRRRLLPGRAGRWAGPRASRPCRWAWSTARLAASACSQSRSTRFHSVLEHTPGLSLGVEDIQPLLQRDRLGRGSRGDPVGTRRCPPGVRTPRRRRPCATPSRASIPPTRSPPGNCRPSSR